MQKNNECSWNPLWKQIMPLLEGKIVHQNPEEEPIYCIMGYKTQKGEVSFGPGSNHIGCVIYEDSTSLENGLSVIFIFMSPYHRVAMGGKWNWNQENAWKAAIKEISAELLRQYQGNRSLIIYWDPDEFLVPYDFQYNPQYLHEYVENLNGRPSILEMALRSDINKRAKNGGSNRQR